MKVVIIEDESPAIEKLERYLKKFDAQIEVLATFGTVGESIAQLPDIQAKADLLFMDIQLMDGLSFDIFKGVEITKPVIFITAFNEYALDAFRANGIDYLLKPITYQDLEMSLQKFLKLKSQFTYSPSQVEALQDSVQSKAASFKNRFMVKLGDHIKSITTDQISFFFADGRDVYLVTNQSRKFIIDFTLETLQGVLDPGKFMRINRSYALNIDAIQDVVVYSNSRLKITPNIKWDPEIIVSREKVGDFKQWFDGH